MKRYSFTKRQENLTTDLVEFDSLEELCQIQTVFQAMQKSNFYRLSIQSWYVHFCSGWYNAFVLCAELHDGYMFEELGNMTKNSGNPVYGLMPRVCNGGFYPDFDPVNELEIPKFENKVATLIGNSAWAVEKIKDIDMVKKFIEYELQYQLEHPRDQKLNSYMKIED